MKSQDFLGQIFSRQRGWEVGGQHAEAEKPLVCSRSHKEAMGAGRQD